MNEVAYIIHPSPEAKKIDLDGTVKHKFSDVHCPVCKHSYSAIEAHFPTLTHAALAAPISKWVELTNRVDEKPVKVTAEPDHRPSWIRTDRLLGEHGIQRDTTA